MYFDSKTIALKSASALTLKGDHPFPPTVYVFVI